MVQILSLTETTRMQLNGSKVQEPITTKKSCITEVTEATYILYFYIKLLNG
ncbi:hypothetical protein Hanom_Chr17g01545171 [Helianthus anomalus]